MEWKSGSHGVPWYHDCRIWKGSGCDFPFSSGELKYVKVDAIVDSRVLKIEKQTLEDFDNMPRLNKIEARMKMHQTQ